MVPCVCFEYCTCVVDPFHDLWLIILLRRTTLHLAVGQRLRLVTHSFAPQYAESLYGIAPEGILVECDPAQRIPDTRLCLVSSRLAN
jgi:hypothetical protein